MITDYNNIFVVFTMAITQMKKKLRIVLYSFIRSKVVVYRSSIQFNEFIYIITGKAYTTLNNIVRQHS